MRFRFDKPTGSYADTKELEYIAALMQTCRPMRPDGSIEVNDIMYLLVSRFGVEVREDALRTDIFSRRSR
ncbi:hypothetical protein IV203_017240 [Nitzschia inconspicua]|uniref:Uncharacterized protein n=1 Tax=Nitzschia inconspicua TaxID=303405 RepID=A0A9K3PII5_9STRA|nr:hypothetical protein IV203_017240 [Nitzschia inconspicua]